MDGWGRPRAFRCTRWTATPGPSRRSPDEALAVEEPLEIRVGVAGASAARSIAITMRTPGHDADLAVGFLRGEGLIGGRADVAACSSPAENVVCVEMAAGVPLALDSLERHFYVSSSCGVCGKTSIDAVRARDGVARLPPGPPIRTDVVHALPAALRRAQSVFEQTKVACTRRGSSTRTGCCGSCARTSVDTTPSTRSSARRSSRACSRSPATC